MRTIRSDRVVLSLNLNGESMASIRYVISRISLTTSSENPLSTQIKSSFLPLAERLHHKLRVEQSCRPTQDFMGALKTREMTTRERKFLLNCVNDIVVHRQPSKTISINVEKKNKLWCAAQQTPPSCCHVAKGQKQQFHYILSR